MSYNNEFEKVFEELLVTKDYHAALTLLRGDQYRGRVRLRCSDAVQACSNHLTDDNYEGNLDLYCCCEEFLKYVAEVGSPDEVLLELLEIIETSRSDNVFTSALKALQICLQNQKRNRANGLEWSLNAIHAFITEIQLPVVLRQDCDERQERLLEQDFLVQRILMNYMTITLFLEPLVETTIKEPRDPAMVFRDTARCRRNILACFVLQLLGSQLSLLDLANREDASTNGNSLHCGKSLTAMLCKLLVDPFFLLSYAESKVRWKRKRLREDEGVYERSSKDIFLMDEKASLTSLGIFYYLLLSEELHVVDSPKVYSPNYLFHMNLYLVNHLLCCDETALHYKGVRLGLKVVQNLKGNAVPSTYLDLKIHQDFCMSICRLMVYSTVDRNRKEGLQLLTQYVLHFDEPGQFYLLQNLIRTTKHNGLMAYLIGMYKNLIAKTIDAKHRPAHIQSNEFKNFVLQTVCTLPQKVETDLVEQSEQILVALNFIRYLAIRDKENFLGFWDFLGDIERSFLKPLRTAIDLSRAHFKAEQQNVAESKDDEVTQLAEEIDVTLQTGEQLPEVTKQHKLNVLEGALLTFDLMDSLLARVNECIEAKRLNKT